MRVITVALALAAVAADFRDVSPNVFPPDDPRTKELPRMVWADAQRRMHEANLRESKAFAAVSTRAQWEAYRDARIKALRESLGEFPPVPKDMPIVVTGKIAGDGFVIHNVVYETRPGLWVAANLYLPAKTPDRMPGVIISHSHHAPKTQGELQDMGMTWARAGTAVLVPDHLGHGERRQHTFNVGTDYPKPFRTGRQDYFFRYNSALQLAAVGESYMGWLVWDLMRGVDVLLQQPGIDKDRIILLGAVAGGGDPAGVTAALDPRIACVVPFNFGGWQPESKALADPDRNFAWFGEGYWETTRGLKGGAAGGFAHFVITGSIAPRKLIYAHEFTWDPAIDPAWPRLQKIYGFYGAKEALAFAHGAGKVTGQGGPANTHCTNIGSVHRKMIYPALKAWFGMPVPEEYSKRRMSAELVCWTEAAKAKLKPKTLHEVVAVALETQLQAAREWMNGRKPEELQTKARERWRKLLGNIDPPAHAKLIERTAEDVPGGKLTRLALEVEPGIVVPFLLITPKQAKGKPPVVVMVAQGGKAAFLKQRGDVIAAFLEHGVAVCLADVRGTGETAPRDASPGRSGARTSISQTEAILGQAVLGSQFRDLRSVIRYLQGRADLDGKRLAVWGDSFAQSNPTSTTFAAPLDAPDLPRYADPGAGMLAMLAALYDGGVRAAYPREVISPTLGSAYIYLPHETAFPAVDQMVLPTVSLRQSGVKGMVGLGDDLNRTVGKPGPTADVVTALVGQLTRK